MKKILLLIILLFLPIALAIPECHRETGTQDIPCNVISTWKPDGGCSGTVTIYNISNETVLTASWGDYFPVCNFTFNISSVGTYHYDSEIEDGVINVEGDDDNMILAVMIFLLLFNSALFILPFKTSFSKSESADYVVKRLIWIAGILFLWFNMTLLRQLSSNWGLGIDNFLVTYWWIFTLAAFAMVFIMVYVMVVGALKLMKEAQMKKRMGGDYQEY